MLGFVTRRASARLLARRTFMVPARTPLRALSTSSPLLSTPPDPTTASAAQQAADNASNLTSAAASAEPTSAQTVAVETSADATHKQGGSDQIFVSNMSFGVTQEAFEDFCAAIAPVARSNLVFRVDGRPTGYGFVTFEDVSKHQEYVAKLDQAEWRGRRLTANLSVPDSRSRRAEAYALANRSSHLFIEGLPRGVPSFDVSGLISVLERNLGVRPSLINVHRSVASPSDDFLRNFDVGIGGGGGGDGGATGGGSSRRADRVTKGSAHAVFPSYELATEAFEKFKTLAAGHMVFEGAPIKLQRPLPSQKDKRLERVSVLQEEPPNSPAGGDPYSAGISAGSDRFR